MTFGTQRLATALLAYLKERVKRGETLSPESPVVTSSGALRGVASRHLEEARFKHGFLATPNLVVEVGTARHVLAPEGVTWRSYVL